MPGSFRAVHALSHTFSGVAGEARVAAELVRCGLKVAKPYWTDDAADLLVLVTSGTAVVPIPVQVKSVQFLPRTDGVPKRRYVQGLKKRYAENSELCLAVYRPDTDAIWFVDGATNIAAVYEAQKSWNKKHKTLAQLGGNDDVRVYIEHTGGIPGDWAVPRDDRAWLTGRLQRMADAVAAERKEVALLESFWPTSDPPEEADDEGGDGTEDVASA